MFEDDEEQKDSGKVAKTEGESGEGKKKESPRKQIKTSAKKSPSPKKAAKKISPAKAYHTMSLETDEEIADSHNVSSDENDDNSTKGNDKTNENSDSEDEENDNDKTTPSRQSCQYGENCYR